MITDECIPHIGAESDSWHWITPVFLKRTADCDANAIRGPDSLWKWTGTHWNDEEGKMAYTPGGAYLTGWCYHRPVRYGACKGHNEQQKNYTDEEWEQLRMKPKPLAGCGPYLMFEDEEYVRELSGVGALNKNLQINGVGFYGPVAPSKNHTIFSDSAMTMSSNSLAERERLAATQQAQQQNMSAQQNAWAQANQPAMLGHNSGLIVGHAAYEPKVPNPGLWTPAEPGYTNAKWPFPSPGNSFFVYMPRTDYDRALEISRRRAERISELTHRLGMLEEVLQGYEGVAAEEPGSHPYHGPVENGKTVPDDVHERFHKAIGDVMAGKVMHEARKQMQESLKNAPKEKTPFPTGVDSSDHRRIGWRTPS